MSIDAIYIQIPYKTYLSKCVFLLPTMRFSLGFWCLNAESFPALWREQNDIPQSTP